MKPAESKAIFKCEEIECEWIDMTFGSQAELESHVKDTHPPIEDPVKFCLDALAKALNLNPDGTEKKKPEASEAKKEVQILSGKDGEKMQKVASKQGPQAIVKPDMRTTQVSAAAPMAKTATQNAALKASPAGVAGLLRTPQQIRTQSPGLGSQQARTAPSGPSLSKQPAGTTASASGDVKGQKKAEETSKDNMKKRSATAEKEPDPWSSSIVRQEDIIALFKPGDESDLSTPGKVSAFLDMREREKSSSTNSTDPRSLKTPNESPEEVSPNLSSPKDFNVVNWGDPMAEALFLNAQLDNFEHSIREREDWQMVVENRESKEEEERDKKAKSRREKELAELEKEKEAVEKERQRIDKLQDGTAAKTRAKMRLSTRERNAQGKARRLEEERETTKNGKEEAEHKAEDGDARLSWDQVYDPNSTLLPGWPGRR